jgi:hypothetical protein
MEEEHFVSSSAKFQPLVRPENTPTTASKKQWWTASFVQENGWSGWLLWGGVTASTASISQNYLY